MSGTIAFAIMAFVIVGSALGMLFSRKTIYSALFLVLNFASVALVYLSLGATFIGLTQIAIYAGAIMVLFLFVIMLLGPGRLPPGGFPLWRRGVAVALGIVFMVELALVVVQLSSDAVAGTPPVDFAGPEAIGMVLFNQYALPLETASIILLVGIIGSIALAQRARKKEKDPFFLQAMGEAAEANLAEEER